MNSILRNASAAAFAFALLTGTAVAAGDIGGAANASGDANVNSSTPNVVPNAAGQNGVPGTKSVTGANADVGTSIGKSQAQLPNDARAPINKPNNDAGTPINNGPTGKVGEPRELVPHQPHQE
jgi:hypothetical protein